MQSVVVLKTIAGAIGVLNGLISLSENSAKYRNIVANAVAEGRDLSIEELDTLETEAIQAIKEARLD
jgi:hypothetical protein